MRSIPVLHAIPAVTPLPLTTSRDSRFSTAYVPSLLEEGVYYPDGQILEEDYEWGSFVQSKMYHEGVTCSDCHDPHTAKLRSTNLNAVCEKCHSAAKFDSPAAPSSPGWKCRRALRQLPYADQDLHGGRCPTGPQLPRTAPGFLRRYGTPNACTQCHKDKSNGWAVDAVVKWYGPNRRQESHFVEAIDAGRRGLPNAERTLTALIQDSAKPAIARATALSLLPAYLSPASMPAVQTALADERRPGTQLRPCAPWRRFHRRTGSTWLRRC